MARAPAGWYVDVQRTETERWFDGSSWTDRRRPATGEVPAVDGGRARWGAELPELSDRPAGLWFRTVLLGAAVAVAGAAVGLLAVLLTT